MLLCAPKRQLRASVMHQSFVTTKEGLEISQLRCCAGKGNADRSAIPHSWWFSDYKMNNWCICYINCVHIIRPMNIFNDGLPSLRMTVHHNFLNSSTNRGDIYKKTSTFSLFFTKVFVLIESLPQYW